MEFELLDQRIKIYEQNDNGLCDFYFNDKICWIRERFNEMELKEKIILISFSICNIDEDLSHRINGLLLTIEEDHTEILYSYGLMMNYDVSRSICTYLCSSSDDTLELDTEINKCDLKSLIELKYWLENNLITRHFPHQKMKHIVNMVNYEHFKKEMSIGLSLGFVAALCLETLTICTEHIIHLFTPCIRITFFGARCTNKIIDFGILLTYFGVSMIFVGKQLSKYNVFVHNPRYHL